ncbi:response regulator transcription factor [Niveibacterium umoris]|uniref:DNA-binding response OmpR family regulator n=1 Tax=Niveibacterium umoris TaxID=1193620 RepID=A0A840BSG2_9RHOO|nr:response regulator transcription factor [Niveibacterium umoris]MBB4013766.1 DNA-binding response OmpR family regulator [Niveibacterium umoris]
MRLAMLEDDRNQSSTVEGWLRDAGHDVHAFAHPRELMKVASRESFDLFLIDWMVPEISGAEVLRWLREDRADPTPVIFVTARDAEEDIVAALSAGADDYIVKPVRRLELLSRIDAVLRRVRPKEPERELSAPPYRFDLANKACSLGDTLIELTDKEFELALFLFRNVGRLYSRGHLLEAVWGRNPNVATRTIDTHVSRLRTKLALRPENGYRLTPTYNYGYRLERLTEE